MVFNLWIYILHYMLLVLNYNALQSGEKYLQISHSWSIISNYYSMYFYRHADKNEKQLTITIHAALRKIHKKTWLKYLFYHADKVQYHPCSDQANQTTLSSVLTCIIRGRRRGHGEVFTRRPLPPSFRLRRLFSFTSGVSSTPLAQRYHTTISNSTVFTWTSCRVVKISTLQESIPSSFPLGFSVKYM